MHYESTFPTCHFDQVVSVQRAPYQAVIVHTFTGRAHRLSSLPLGDIFGKHVQVHEAVFHLRPALVIPHYQHRLSSE